ncbi:MAG: BCD family MFS transporter [Minwuia sp.]|uniref:BCD family MFS transporter n=1 Tax=Minwuia sp. TaxID=2493630 RepID=UPI003A856A54
MQTALGAIVVLTTSTMNRVMVVELALPAMLPGLLVGLHYAVQLLRPRLGHGSDIGRRRTPWIVGGMAVLALGGVGAAGGTALMETHLTAGIVLALIAFMAIGVGVGSAGTSLLVLLAKQVAPGRRPAAATIVWLMMIAGFAVTATLAGGFLDPYSPERLIAVTATVSAAAFALSVLAIWGIENRAPAPDAAAGAPKPAFVEALSSVWREPVARRFTVFVFVSMLAYSAQDLILEPFAGTVFGMTPGESTRLAGLQHGGVFVGMILVAIVGSLARGRRLGSLRAWTIGGCIASAAALILVGAGGLMAETWPLKATVFALGAANGAFAVAAIGSMMELVSQGGGGREGVRMGLWGAAQAIAFGLGGFIGTLAIDAVRALIAAPEIAYAIVFTAEGLTFLVAALLAARIARESLAASRARSLPPGVSVADASMG